ncbi:MAG: hypothetical protein O2794_01295 [bacterium]|nr:hypothetical protein [bacterium]
MADVVYEKFAEDEYDHRELTVSDRCAIDTILHMLATDAMPDPDPDTGFKGARIANPGGCYRVEHAGWGVLYDVSNDQQSVRILSYMPEGTSIH